MEKRSKRDRIRIGVAIAIASVLFPFIAFASAPSGDMMADMNPAGSGGCNPEGKYDPTMSKGQVDRSGLPGLLGIACVDPTSGQAGVCAKANVCEATGEKGAPTSQQIQQANNGNSASGAPAQGPAGSSKAGGSNAPAQVSANPGISTAALTPQQNPSQSTQALPASQNPQTALGPGTSVIQSAYEWLTGQNSSLPQYQGGEPNGPDTRAQPSAQPSWLTSAQQYQIQSDVPAPPLQSSDQSAPPGGNSLEVNPGFAPVSTPQGNLGPSASDAAYANTLISESPAQQAADAVQNIEQTGQGWAQSALQYFDQSTINGQATAPSAGPASDVEATIYYPGCVGAPSGCDVAVEGGPYGSRNNYLDPSVPTVAAGYGSGYSYGQVVSVTNPTTGQSTNAVVGDVCPGCGSGIDLNPAAASAVGLTLDQGRGAMQVAVVADTSGYANGAQLAVNLNSDPYALDPWSAPQGSLPAMEQMSGSFAENGWTQSVGGFSQFDSGALVQSLPASPSGEVESAPLPLSDQQIAANVPIPQQVDTNPQEVIQEQNAQDAQQLQLADRLAQADQETNAFNNPPLPSVDTSVQSGSEVTKQVYESALAGADQNVPIPTQAETNVPTQAEAQSELLRQGVQLTSLDANSFYQSVLGSEIAQPGPATPAGVVETGGELPEPGPANPAGVVTEGPPLEQPYPAGVVSSQPLPAPPQGASNEPISQSEPIQTPPLPESRPSLPRNPSIVDYMNAAGQDTSFAARADLAVALGIVKSASRYVGSAAQNIALLKACWNGLCF